AIAATASIWSDAPQSGPAIPDPVTTDQVVIATSPDGRAAAAWPARPGSTLSALAIWDLVEGRLRHHLELAAAPDRVVFNADATRLLAIAGNALTLWDVEVGLQITNAEASTGFILPPAVSS